MPNPPKLFLRFLKWFCNPNLHKPIEGDLLEFYDENVELHGKRRADFIFIKDVLLLFRKDIIKPLGGTYSLNTFGMLSHQIKLAFRSFKRFKNSFLINILGLSTGLTAVLLIYLWINDELSVDKFHQNDEQLYQAMQNINNPDETFTLTNTPALLAQTLEEELPEVEVSASMIPVGSYGSDRVIQYEDRKLKMDDIYASEKFFEVFSYELVSGDEKEVLSKKEYVLVSESFGSALFGETDPIGKVVQVEEARDTRTYIISGVFADLPKESSKQFDVIFTMEAFLDMYPHIREWGNSDPSTFLVLKENTDVDQLSSKIENFITTKEEGYRHTLFLQKYSERYLNGNYENGQIAGGRILYVKLFSAIAILVLVIACINFVNLSTARVSRRIKEIGVKKAIGATRGSLISQFIVEAGLIISMSMVIAVMAAILLLPYFNVLTGKSILLNFDWSIIQFLLMVTLVTTILSGGYPALYLSGFSTLNLFQGRVKGSFAELWARKGLVIFQFAVSVVLITSVLVVSSQVDFILNRDLGFQKDHIIYFNSDGSLQENATAFIDELKKETSVINAAQFGHDLLGNRGQTSGVRWEGKGPDEFVQFGNLEVGYNLIETFDLEIIAGRSFSEEHGDDGRKILFNEEAIKVMRIEDPIGKIVNLWGYDREIIGVVKNFHFESLHKEITPCFFQFTNAASSIVVRIQSGNELKTIERLEEIYQAHNPGLPFTFKFFDEEYDALYRSELQISTLAKYFGAIAILISCLGLFGLVAFTTERRQKEIGIRKVLGSSEFNLMMLLSSDFSKMVAIGILIALPISYLLVNGWLESFAYRIDLKFTFFISSGLISMGIAWITLGFQTLKAAKSNPVESLRYE